MITTADTQLMQYENIVLISILSTLRNNQDEDYYRDNLNWLYHKYQNTKFIIANLKEEEKQDIMNSYLTWLSGIWKEEIHAV